MSAAHGDASAPGEGAGDAAEAAAPRVPQAVALASGVVVALFTLAIGLAALTLLVFQLALMLRGETTWEHLRREQLNSSLNLPPQLRPYDRGALTNALAFCGCTVGCLQPQPHAAAAAAAGKAPLAAYPAADLHLLPTYCPPARPAKSRGMAPAPLAAAPDDALDPAEECALELGDRARSGSGSLA